MRCDRRSCCMGGYHWYYCWYIGIIVIHTATYEGLQNQKNVRCIHPFDDSHSKWNVSVGYLWPHQI